MDTKWFAEILTPAIEFKFNTTMSYEECLNAISALRHRHIHWWENNSFGSETSGILTRIDADTCHFSLERTPYRFVPLKAVGFVTRGDGVFTKVTGVVSSNNRPFLLFGAGLAFVIVLISRLEFKLAVLIFIPAAFMTMTYCFMTGYILNRIYCHGFLNDIQKHLGIRTSPEPIHKPSKKKSE
ncbi:MAG: hypothetical protein ABI947_16820 [Chloroflexota bacterium]